MRKGQTIELFEILILIIGITILLTSSYYFLSITGEKSSQVIVEEKEFNRILNDVTAFFYNRIPIIDKNLAQVLGDFLRWGEDSHVFYGKYYGSLNVKEIIENYFNSTFEDRWYLETSYKGKKVEFGFKTPENMRLRTFIIKLSIPKSLTDGEVIDVVFTQW